MMEAYKLSFAQQKSYVKKTRVDVDQVSAK